MVQQSTGGIQYDNNHQKAIKQSNSQEEGTLLSMEEEQQQQQHPQVSGFFSESWKQPVCDFSQYEKSNLDHMKHAYRPPQISDYIEKIELEDQAMTVCPVQPISIPRCNTAKLDISFLDSYQQIQISDKLTKFIPQLLQLEEQLEQWSLEPSPNENKHIGRIINSSWCRDVLILYEERSLSGDLIDLYRNTNEKRKIKLHCINGISQKWKESLESMQEGETSWFKVDKTLTQQQQDIILKIEVVEVRALKFQLTKISKKERKRLDALIEDITILQSEANAEWKYVKGATVELNEQGKQIFKETKDYESAGEVFRKAYTFCRSLTNRSKKYLDKDKVIEQEGLFEQTGGNYIQCMMNQQKYKEVIGFYQQSKLKSTKNIYRICKAHMELRNFEGALEVINGVKAEGEQEKEIEKQKEEEKEEDNMKRDSQFVLPKELVELQGVCLKQLALLEKSSISNFYSKVFSGKKEQKKSEEEEVKEEVVVLRD